MPPSACPWPSLRPRPTPTACWSTPASTRAPPTTCPVGSFLEGSTGHGQQLVPNPAPTASTCGTWGRPSSTGPVQDLDETRRRSYACLSDIGERGTLAGKNKLFCVDNHTGGVIDYYAHISSRRPLPVSREGVIKIRSGGTGSAGGGGRPGLGQGKRIARRHEAGAGREGRRPAGGGGLPGERQGLGRRAIHGRRRRQGRVSDELPRGRSPTAAGNEHRGIGPQGLTPQAGGRSARKRLPGMACPGAVSKACGWRSTTDRSEHEMPSILTPSQLAARFQERRIRGDEGIPERRGSEAAGAGDRPLHCRGSALGPPDSRGL